MEHRSGFDARMRFLLVVVLVVVVPGVQAWWTMMMTVRSPRSCASSLQSTTRRCCDFLEISRNRRSPSSASCNYFLHSTAASADDLGRTFAASATTTTPAATTIHLEDLMEMDVVVFSATSSSSKYQQRQLGAVQDDGRVTPLCVWTLEPAFATSLEFLVDEHDLLPGYTSNDEIVIYSIVPQDKLSYGSRQVGGGMGPGNPHGEESELLYYVDQSIIDENFIQVVVKPELEIFW